MFFKIYFMFFTVFMTVASYAKETCVRNDEGVFCGTEIYTNNSFNKKECVEFNGKKFCGYECEKNLWGADCKKEKNEMCLKNLKGVICGFNCKKNVSVAGCASLPFYKCFIRFDEVLCGTDCRYELGKVKCDIVDPKAKYLK